MTFLVNAIKLFLDKNSGKECNLTFYFNYCENRREMWVQKRKKSKFNFGKDSEKLVNLSK